MKGLNGFVLNGNAYREANLVKEVAFALPPRHRVGRAIPKHICHRQESHHCFVLCSVAAENNAAFRRYETR